MSLKVAWSTRASSRTGTKATQRKPVSKKNKQKEEKVEEEEEEEVKEEEEETDYAIFLQPLRKLLSPGICIRGVSEWTPSNKAIARSCEVEAWIALEKPRYERYQSCGIPAKEMWRAF